MQSTHGGLPCDQIFRIPADGSGAPTRISSGEGRTTCSYFTYPEGDRILYSTTALASPECPPSPDFSMGYVWALYDSYEIVSVAPDGSDLVRLTDQPGYDAEATICPVDGTVIFTSDRDGDLELYTMRPDGTEVKRLTHTPGYDGGAFFSPDCSKIVWRASRPEGKELEDYQQLLAEGLIRPNKLEIWVADRDGSNARQITFLDAASFAPSFFPSGDRVIFSSNHGSAGPREFDLWAVDVDGTDLEQITFTAGVRRLPPVLAGRHAPGLRLEPPPPQGGGDQHLRRPLGGRAVGARSARGRAEDRAPDRFMADVAWLADDAREGRGIETRGLVEARDWIARRFEALGLEPAGEEPTAADLVPALRGAGVGRGAARDGARDRRRAGGGRPARAGRVLRLRRGRGRGGGGRLRHRRPGAGGRRLRRPRRHRQDRRGAPVHPRELRRRRPPALQPAPLEGVHRPRARRGGR